MKRSHVYRNYTSGFTVIFSERNNGTITAYSAKWVAPAAAKATEYMKADIKMILLMIIVSLSNYNL